MPRTVPALAGSRATAMCALRPDPRLSCRHQRLWLLNYRQTSTHDETPHLPFGLVSNPVSRWHRFAWTMISTAGAALSLLSMLVVSDTCSHTTSRVHFDSTASLPRYVAGNLRCCVGFSVLNIVPPLYAHWVCPWHSPLCFFLHMFCRR